MRYFIVLLLMSSTAFAQSVYMQKCASCHGDKGQGMPNFAPRLAGQYAFYLKAQIRDIKTGKRSNGLSSTMQPIFKGLTDKQVSDMADWLESL